MFRRALFCIVVALTWLACAPQTFAGISCYEYQYAPNLVRKVQKLLQEQGLYKGAVDGKWGPRTESAVSLFQDLKDIHYGYYETMQSGQLDDRTLKVMFGEEVLKDVKAGRKSVPCS